LCIEFLAGIRYIKAPDLFPVPLIVPQKVVKSTPKYLFFEFDEIFPSELLCVEVQRFLEEMLI